MAKKKAPEELSEREEKRRDTSPKERKPAAKKVAEKEQRLLALRESAPNNDVENYDPDRPLTTKMKQFVTFWAQGETILSAAVRAGYSDGGSMAYKLARDPAILKLYNAEKEAYAASVQMTRQKVMEGLLEGVEMAKMMSEPASVISGWREIGKMCGYYEPVRKKIEINVKGDVTMKHLNKMTDADLLKIVKGEVTDVAFKEVADGDDDEDGDND